MAIQVSLSGGQTNTSAKGSLGGIRSDTVVVTDVAQNFFDDISRTEGLVGKTEYRCGYIYNPDATTYTGVTIEITINPTVGLISLGLDLAGKGDGRTTGVADTIATEGVTPTNVTFFGEENEDDGIYDRVVLPIGLLRQGESVAFWMKRKTEQGPSATITTDFTITYDTVSISGENVSDGGAFGELIKAVKLSSPFYIGTAKIGQAEVGSS